ncbi:T-box-containing protein TBX6L-like [Hetaerina americana]|uniref:T-box-containing protein TBX6L-like n=1 Tax=Hetaerina americana TaxID=62018 RepID=UPI003A7F4953
MDGTQPGADGRQRRGASTDAQRLTDDARHLGWAAGSQLPEHRPFTRRHPSESAAATVAGAGGVSVTLENADLWRKFHRIGTEMIITKTGRRMFPSLQISVSGLDPDAEYYFLLELALVPAPGAHHRLRFSGREWVVAGRGEAQAPAGARTYVHPESPAPGARWMKTAVISFSKVKLTNNSLDGCGHVVLTSMHKYIPRIHIVKASDYLSLSWGPEAIFSFPETEFVAVTAYQNGKITKLKIDHNPFAKGFRETGMSKSKRKLEQMMVEATKDEDDRGQSTDEEELVKSPCLDHNNNGSGSGIQRKIRPCSVQSKESAGSRRSRSPVSSPEGSHEGSHGSHQSVADDYSAMDFQANPRLPIYDHFPGYFPLLWASFAHQAAKYSPHHQYYSTQGSAAQQHLDQAMSRLAFPPSSPFLPSHHPIPHPMVISPWKAPLYSPTSYNFFSPQAVNPYLQHNLAPPCTNISQFLTPNLPTNLEKPPYLLDLSSKHA